MTIESPRTPLIVTEATGAGTSTPKEIDFGHHKEALVFDQNLGGRYDYAVAQQSPAAQP